MNSSRAVNLGLATLILILALGGVMFQMSYERRIEAEGAARLTTMLMLRASVLEGHFESLRSEIILWSGSAVVIDIMKSLNPASAAGTTTQPTDMITSELWKDSAAPGDTPVSLRVRKFAEHHEYHDVFLIGVDGDVLFTIAGEADLGTNLNDGPYTDTGLGRLFRTLMESGDDMVAMSDFSLYPPSNNEPAAFLGAKVISDGELLGVYAIQIPEQPINEIMQFSAGMGDTGETYLVGEDRLMRSTSRFFEKSTVLRTEVSGATLEAALRGETGIDTVDDYRGVPVYSAYQRFDFEDIHWAVLAEQDVAEIRAPIIRVRLWLLGGVFLSAMIVFVLRHMLVRVVLPSSIAALLGLTFVSMESQADD